MANSKLLKREEDQNRTGRTVCSLGTYALAVFQRVVDPDRIRVRKTDVRYAKHLVELVASALASGGPKSLDEAVTTNRHRYRIEELPAFASALGSLGDWQNSLAFASHLSSIVTSLISSTNPSATPYPEIFETLGMLSYLETRIAKVLERPK